METKGQRNPKCPYELPISSIVLPGTVASHGRQQASKTGLLWPSWTQGFNTRATEALRLANDLGLDIFMEKNVFSASCKQAIKHNFTSALLENLQNTELNPLLRAYRTFKHEFAMEPYLYHVKKIQIPHSHCKVSLQLAYIRNRKRSSHQPKSPCCRSKMSTL